MRVRGRTGPLGVGVLGAGPFAGLFVALTAGLCSADPRVAIAPLAAGHFRPGEPYAIRLQLTNSDGPGGRYGVTLEQSAGSAGTTTPSRAIVELPSRSHKELLAFVPTSDGDGKFIATLRDDEGHRIEAVEIDAEPLEPQERLVAVIGSEPVGLLGLKLEAPAVHSAAISGPLPTDWAAWRGFDVVVWPDPDTQALDPAALGALTTWVHAGGQLVVFTPRGRSPFAGSALEDLLPALVDDRVAVAPTLDVSEAPLTRARLSRRGGERLLGSDDDPIAILAQRGLGRVVVVGFDPRLQAFRAAAGARSFWGPLIDRLAPLPPATESAPWRPHWAWNNALQMMPGVTTQAVWLVAALLAAYLVAIGPIDFLVQRRYGRRPWAWITYPAIVVGFSAAILAVSVSQRNSGVRLRVIEVEDFRDGHSSGHASVAVAAEKRASTTLRSATASLRFASSSGLDQELATPPVHDGSARAVEHDLEAWLPSRSNAVWTRPAAEVLDATRAGDDWQVRSRLPHDLRRVVVGHGDRFWEAGPLLAGGAVVAVPNAQSLTFRPQDNNPAEALRGVESEILSQSFIRRRHSWTQQHDDNGPDPNFSWLWLDPAEVADDTGCVVVFGFADDLPSEITADHLLDVQTLHAYRQFICQGDPGA